MSQSRTHPAASEAPQDAREVERRERWAAVLKNSPERAPGWDFLAALMGEADREQATLVAERDALQWDLAQAVSERDRLRERVEAWIDQVESEQPHDATGYAYDQRQAMARSLRFTIDPPAIDFPPLATPDADAQDEGVRRG